MLGPHAVSTSGTEKLIPKSAVEDTETAVLDNGSEPKAVLSKKFAPAFGLREGEGELEDPHSTLWSVDRTLIKRSLLNTLPTKRAISNRPQV